MLGFFLLINKSCKHPHNRLIYMELRVAYLLLVILQVSLRCCSFAVLFIFFFKFIFYDSHNFFVSLRFVPFPYAMYLCFSSRLAHSLAIWLSVVTHSPNRTLFASYLRKTCLLFEKFRIQINKKISIVYKKKKKINHRHSFDKFLSLDRTGFYWLDHAMRTNYDVVCD